MQVGVIGAGLSGLVAAVTLREAGHDVVVIEKSRGVGGRLAARRVAGTVVDHGAPVIPFTLAGELAAFLEWVPDGERVELSEGVAFRAGATQLAKAMAAKLDVVLGSRVAALRSTSDGRLELAAEQGNTHGVVDAVIVTAPAPQAADLLEQSPENGPRVAALRAVDYDPAVMLLAGLAMAEPASLDPVTPPRHFQRITAESVKGRGVIAGIVPVVARIEPERSAALIDTSDDAILDEFTSPLLAACDADGPPAWIQVKRWRYATCATPTTFAAINPPDSPIVVCGDTVVGTDLVAVCETGRDAAHRVMALRK
jgi:hypothetical protein